jgi:hypothetical protein
MDLEKRPAVPAPEPPARPRQPEGCLVVALRIPVRIVVLVLVVPVRIAWDALVVAGRFLTDTVLRPLGRALAWVGRALFVWPWVALWRYALVPVGRGIAWLGHVLLVVPAVWLYRYALTPLGHGIGRLGRGLWAGVAWVGRGLWTGAAWIGRGLWAGAVRAGRGIGAGLGWLYAWVLTPVGHGLAWLVRGIGTVLAALGTGVYTGAARLAKYLLVVPAVALYRYVLTPLGHGLAWIGRGLLWLGQGLVRLGGAILTGIGLALYWTGRVLLVLPALALWRWVLAPVGHGLAFLGREIGEALGHAWRIAGYVSQAVGRFLGTLFRLILVEPVRWAYRTVLTPIGHVVRDALWRPAADAARSVGRATRQALAAARESARQARADIRHMLLGAPKERQPLARREPEAREARTLDKRSGPEVTPPARG